MTRAQRRKEFDAKAEGSVELGRDLVQNVLKWTEFIPERAISTEDHAAMLDAFWNLYRVLQPLNEKYVDGDDGKDTE